MGRCRENGTRLRLLLQELCAVNRSTTPRQDRRERPVLCLVLDGEPLIVPDPTFGRGFRLTMSRVGDNSRVDLPFAPARR